MPDSGSDPVPSTTPRVSIVVPAFNREHFIEATLKSVIDQTMPAWELVLFDDGSTDSTADVARRFAGDDPRITVLSGANGGVASARSRGLAATDLRSEFVIFLDSDDVFERDALDVLLDALERDPRYGSVYGLARCIDNAGVLITGDDLEDRMRERCEYRNGVLQPIDPDEPTTFAGLVYHNYVVTPGIHLIRRSVLAQVGDFDPTTDPADDWDIVLRMSRIAEIGFVDRCVLNWRRHPDTLTTTSPRWRKAYFRVRAKTVSDIANTDEQRDVARLAYRAMNNSSLTGARDELRHRNFGSATRLASKGIGGYAHYLWAATNSLVRSFQR